MRPNPRLNGSRIYLAGRMWIPSRQIQRYLKRAGASVIRDVYTADFVVVSSSHVNQVNDWVVTVFPSAPDAVRLAVKNRTPIYTDGWLYEELERVLGEPPVRSSGKRSEADTTPLLSKERLLDKSRTLVEESAHAFDDLMNILDKD